MYAGNLDVILRRYEEYWNKENHDRPLMSIYARKDGAVPKAMKRHSDIKDNWWDTELIIQSARNNMEATAYFGEAIPQINPNLGPDVFAAFLGAELVFGNDTSWAVNFVEDWTIHNFKFDENNIYWKKIAEITEACLDNSNGDYLVGLTDIHQGFDCLVSMRGAENVCMDLYDCPDQIKRVLLQIEEAFGEVIRRSYAIVSKKQRGMTNWMGLYHPESWYVSSSDFIYMISPETFDQFSSESIKREAKIIGNNIFHLDGVGSLNHLDKLLAMPEINGVQWVYGDGKPTASHWIDVLKRIQGAGKLVEVACVPEDMPALLASGLKPEGVHYTLTCGNESHARKILSEATESYRKRIF